MPDSGSSTLPPPAERTGNTRQLECRSTIDVEEGRMARVRHYRSVVLLASLLAACGSPATSPAPPSVSPPTSAPASLAAPSAAVAPASPAAPSTAYWLASTDATIGETAEWTNKVELADVDGDGDVDILFANGGLYDRPGEPEPTRVFVNDGRARFTDRSTDVFGDPLNLARVVKVRDVNGDGNQDIVIGTTYQTQSRLLLGRGGLEFEDVTATHLPAEPLSVGDLEVGDVDADGDVDMVLAD